jgi:transcriptional regulator with XRE-family HTH domain
VSKPEHQRPGQVFARRVKEARNDCGWTQQQLVDRLAELGYPISRPTLIRIEAGGTRSEKAPLQEVFALAAALGVKGLLELLEPLDGEPPVAIAPHLIFVSPLVREWMRGELVLPMTAGVDIDEITDDELQRLIEREFTRGMSEKRRRKANVGEAASLAVAEIRRFRKEGPDA